MNNDPVRNRLPIYNYRWGADYSPGTPFFRTMNFTGPSTGFRQAGGGQLPPAGGGTNPPPAGGGGNQMPWQFPTLLQSPLPYSLGPDWRKTMGYAGQLPPYNFNF